METIYTLGIDIGSTTVKIAILDPTFKIMFADYRRHHADIQGTLRGLVQDASTRKLVRAVVNPCQLGQMGETHLLIEPHWQSRFAQSHARAAQGQIGGVEVGVEEALSLGGQATQPGVRQQALGVLRVQGELDFGFHAAMTPQFTPSPRLTTGHLGSAGGANNASPGALRPAP